MPQTHSEPESSPRGELEAEGSPAGQDNGGSMSGSNSAERRAVEARPDVAAREVRDFLAGRTPEVSKIDPAEKDTRRAVAEELLSVIGSKSIAATSPSNAGPSGNGNEEHPTNKATNDYQMNTGSEQAAKADQAERDRARQLFVDQGYFDEAIESLRSATSPSERVASARIIGSVGNRLGNVHLIAALFDDAQEVRDAATAALAELGASTATDASMVPPENVGSTAPLAKPELVEIAPAVVEIASAAEEQPEIGLTEAIVSSVAASDESVPNDEAKLLLDEAAARKELEDLQHRLDDAANSRMRLQREAEQRLESEARISAEAATRRREEEELRRRAEDEAAQRRREEEEKLAAAHVARIKAEEEAQRFAQEDARLRLEVSKLRLAAEEIARTRAELHTERRVAAERVRLAETERTRQLAEAAHKAEMERLRREEESLGSALAETALRRAEVETARHEANQETLRLAEEREQLAVAEAARLVEAERLREAEEKSRAEQEELVQQVGAMRRIAEEVAARRAEVEAAREKAVAEAEQLVEAQARMKAADEARQQAEAERSRVEAELIQKAETERRLLDEVRLKAEEEKQRLEAGERYRAAEQEQRLSQLAEFRQRIETEAQQRAEKERQISSQIESLRIADTQARKRIEDAETRRRTAEESYRLVAEKTQRVEAEARKGEIAEQQTLAKLEEVRRNVAVAMQSAAEQEKRIKEETEQLRRFEEAQRHRIEEAARSRAEAELRLQQEKARLHSEEEARLRAAEQFDRLIDRQQPVAAEDAGEWHDDPAENLRPSKRPIQPQLQPQAQTILPAPPSFASPLAAAASTARAPESVSSYHATNSADELKRDAPETGFAAASALAPAPVSEQDEFSRITARFDDPSPDVRKAAARELRELDPPRMVESFTRALEEASPERRGNIGSAISTSGLAAELIDMLGGESREETYSALCLLLTMAKTGEVAPLVRAIEVHENVYVRIAAVRLLTLNGQEEVANAAARRRLEGRS
ncbi:MAG: hypothetical protein H7Z16_10350 [Pyrinomonadaceae bacterium]|nr:hypothetical protein [Pyrinomonadaceae bacterium]